MQSLASGESFSETVATIPQTQTLCGTNGVEIVTFATPSYGRIATDKHISVNEPGRIQSPDVPALLLPQ